VARAVARPPELVELFLTRLPRETGDIAATVDAACRWLPQGAPGLRIFDRAVWRAAATPHAGTPRVYGL
jgi:hypothetical protein